jgi:glutamate racemase
LATIGVFDSGVGGLSVLRAVRQQRPGDTLLYVADSAYAPYGDRPDNYILDRARAVADFLLEQHVDALVVASNTVTAIAIADLRARLTIPVVGIEPGVKPAVAATRTGCIGVLATSATVAGAKFKALLERHGDAARILVQACPGLVDQVERGDLAGPATRALLARYVDPLVAGGADVLVIGCTHYAFLKPAIRDVAGPGVIALIDPSDAVALQLTRRLEETGVAPLAGTSGSEVFWTSAEPQTLEPLVARLWGGPVSMRQMAPARPV